MKISMVTQYRIILVGIIVTCMVAVTTPAVAGERYCGLSVKVNFTSRSAYVSQAWDRPGWRLMSTRKHWSTRNNYYICKP